MKKTFYQSRILKQILLALLVCPLFAYSQEDMVEYFPGGAANAALLTREYIRPAAEGGASAINSGWYSSGKPHAKFGFEISITFNTYFVPSEDEFYDATNLGLSGLLVTSNATQVPTLFGPKGIAFNPIFQINDGSTNDGAIFAGPDGSPPSDDFLINALVVPTLQGSIGLWKETELKIRFAPTLKFGGTEYSTFGIGLMHSIKQYIPALKSLPFGWSIFAGWTKSTGEIDLSDNNSSNPGGYIGGANQRAEFDVTGITIQMIASKKFSVLTVYGGFGYNIGNADYSTLGTYIFDRVDVGGGVLLPLPPGADNPITLTDPFDLEFDENSFRGQVGLKLKFGPVYLNADYTLASTKILAVGFGFSFKE